MSREKIVNDAQQTTGAVQWEITLAHHKYFAPKSEIFTWNIFRPNAIF